ncbi:Zinc finger protein 277 like protein [Aduncisulcus paluster]|uniref:Zinc finger protein 277 like protein n=1 Tax=Aduncisulcus paluster TaxID=2918883 RepID=A0ABQ5KPB0_9EUKA|nr:Zinc finger protein 277 like protein [Aduncisulcus paluster]
MPIQPVSSIELIDDYHHLSIPKIVCSCDLCKCIKTNVPSTRLLHVSPKQCRADKTLRELTFSLSLDLALKQTLRERKSENFFKSFCSNPPKYPVKCPMCPFIFKDACRDAILHHYISVHHFHFGQADNLVYIPLLLQTISKFMDDLKCLCCSKDFPDYKLLRTHLRKKHHFKIPPTSEFDKFFIINYAKSADMTDSKSSSIMAHLDISEKDEEKKVIEDEDEEEPKSELDEELTSNFTSAVCPICDFEVDFDETKSDRHHHGKAIIDHLKLSHNLDIFRIKDFYPRVRWINHLRICKSKGICVCGDDLSIKFSEIKDFYPRVRWINHLRICKSKGICVCGDDLSIKFSESPTLDDKQDIKLWKSSEKAKILAIHSKEGHFFPSSMDNPILSDDFLLIPVKNNDPVIEYLVGFDSLDESSEEEEELV